MTRSVPALTVVLSLAATLAAAGVDGHRFDTGATLTAPAEGAPPETAQLAALVGDWDVTWTTVRDDVGETSRACSATITYVNRGHGFMERLYCPAATDSPEVHALALIAYDPGNSVWARAEADSASERIRLTTGGFADGVLRLFDSLRPGGGPRLLHRRDTLVFSDAGFALRSEESVGDHADWHDRARRTYARRAESALPPGDEAFGSPAEGLPAEARQFDFLIGKWTSSHDLTLPGGQQIQWTSDSSAVYALGGHAILEFDWFDVDPSLPDAATTILRIYNRAMRRWESLFLANRGNSMLHFGGRQEGDRVVLHSFGADTVSTSISHYIFHDIRPDAYDWYSESSTDRGETFSTGWVIQVRRDEAQPTTPEPAGR